MAAPFAYEPPSAEKAWQAFRLHIATIALIWLVMIIFSMIGLAVAMVVTIIGFSFPGSDPAGAPSLAQLLAQVLAQLGQLPFSILSSLVGVLMVAVPATYYATGETVTIAAAFGALTRRPLRYLLAGVLFSVVVTIGLILCILPGLAVALVTPVYVNRIFLTDLGIVEAFSSSFQSVYRSPHGMTFVGIQLLVWLAVMAVTLITCGVGVLVAVPVAAFYLQNSAYHQGVLT